jgi:hypothetical protein
MDIIKYYLYLRQKGFAFKVFAFLSPSIITALKGYSIKTLRHRADEADGMNLSPKLSRIRAKYYA